MLLLLGDWVPEQTQPVLRVAAQDALVLLNLEGPILTDPARYTPILKAGPHLYSTSLPEFDAAAAVCFALANNHIKDYGWDAVEATRARLAERGYASVGVGENEALAREPVILSVQGRQYGILSLGEIQAGRATAAQPGIAPLGPWVYPAIARLRPQVNRVIVSVHAANEMLPWPSPLVQDLYRSYIEAGADIVHGHHAHVPQGVESYQSGVICYGLGNFLGDPARYGRFEVQLSFGVRITDDPDQLRYTIEPYRFYADAGHVVVARAQGEQVESYLAAVQAPLADRPLLEALWQEAALRLYDTYGRDTMALPHTTEKQYTGGLKPVAKSLARQMMRRFALTPRGVRQNQMLWYHMFSCLSHQHMMETALGLLCGEITDVRTPQARDLVAQYLARR